MPLPLISYGGTAMLTVMFGMGLLMSVYVHRDTRIGRFGESEYKRSAPYPCRLAALPTPHPDRSPARGEGRLRAPRERSIVAGKPPAPRT